MIRAAATAEKYVTDAHEKRGRQRSKIGCTNEKGKTYLIYIRSCPDYRGEERRSNLNPIEI